MFSPLYWAARKKHHSKPNEPANAQTPASSTTARVAVVCEEHENLSELRHRLNDALDKAGTQNTVIEEFLPETKRRR
jgi:hypothetical protein